MTPKLQTFYCLGFEVWTMTVDWKGIEYMECVAAFSYWQECLDYKDYALGKGIDCVLCSLEPKGLSWRSE